MDRLNTPYAFDHARDSLIAGPAWFFLLPHDDLQVSACLTAQGFESLVSELPTFRNALDFPRPSIEAEYWSLFLTLDVQSRLNQVVNLIDLPESNIGYLMNRIQNPENLVAVE